MPQPQKVINTRNNPPHKSYKHISIVFMILAILLILGVTYLALSKVTIILHPSNEKITHTFDLLVYQNELPTSTDKAVISGKIITATSTVTQKFPLTTGKLVDTIAKGKVILYNDRDTTQTLVATTRLLSSKNILFRLKDKITIPAHASTTVTVYADKKGITSNIEPTTFTIPGLTSTLQKLVYAKSVTPITGGTQQIGDLTQTEVDQAMTKFGKNDSANLLAKYIDATANMTLIDTNIKTTDIDLVEKIGSQVTNFTLHGQLTVNAIFANKNDILEAAKNETSKNNTSNKSFISIDPSSLKYKIKKITATQHTAIISVSFSGLATLDPQTNIFDKNLLIGFTKSDLKLYFSQFSSINNIDVTFSPFWVSKVPILKDHINIQIAK